MVRVILLVWLAATASAQALPPMSRTYSEQEVYVQPDDVLNGNEFRLRLARQGETTLQVLRVRLVGIDAPRSTGGGAVEDLADRARASLRTIIAGQPLRLIVWGAETFYEPEPNDPRRLPLPPQTRYVATVAVRIHYKDVAGKWFVFQNVAHRQLYAGYAWLDCRRAAEIEDDRKRYEVMQADARANERGIWYWKSPDADAPTWGEGCLKKPGRSGSPHVSGLPKR